MFRKKKFLGQIFLSNTNILMAMIRAARVSKKDMVLEVGPGMGTLTALLAQHAKKVVAIEKDRDLIPLLREKFSQIKNVEIIEGDVLNLVSLIPSPLQGEARRGNNNYKLPTTDYKLVSNIPYYLTARFLRIFLGAKRKPALMVLMIQQEVAQRILARNGKESLLSLSVKAYGTPVLIRKVPRGAFSPSPKVDSAIIKIGGISNAWFVKNTIKPDYFFDTLRLAFQKKRKTLRNSLGKSLKNLELEPKILSLRPEDLSLKDWVTILH